MVFNTPLTNVNALKNHVQLQLLHKKLKTFATFARYFLHYFVLPFHRCLANAISRDYVRLKAGQYTSRNGSKSVVARYDHTESSRALTARELPC